jgi:predicted acetyltransferase
VNYWPGKGPGGWWSAPSTRANATLYRQLGYEYAGVRPKFRVPLAELPATKGDVRQLADDEVDQVMECFSRFARAHNGPVEVRDPACWADHVFGHKGEGNHPRTVVVPGQHGFDGYASYYLDNRPEGGYRLNCRHLVALSPTALSSLLGYFRRFQNAADDLSWSGPLNMGAVGLSLHSNAFSIAATLSRWMLRVVDLQPALEARGYAKATGEAVIAVEDPHFPANAGPWVLQAAGGKVKASHAGAAEIKLPAKPIPIGLLSAFYSGFATADDLVLMGGLEEDDPALALMSALFAGPVPWMPVAF